MLGPGRGGVTVFGLAVDPLELSPLLCEHARELDLAQARGFALDAVHE